MDEGSVFRVIIVGDTGVGKSCFLLRFCENTFKNQHNVTIGVQFGSKQMEVDNQRVKLQIWDTAGQESFRSITRSFYRRAEGVLLIYDITARHTFESCEYWIEEIRQNSPIDVVVYLIGNQIDLIENQEEDRQVSFQQGLALTNKHQLNGFLQTSARTGYHVQDAFLDFVKELMNRNKQKSDTKPKKSRSGVPLSGPVKKKRKCC